MIRLTVDKPNWTRKQAEQILKECDDVEDALNRLRDRARKALEEPAKVVTLIGRKAYEEGN
jgi:hypothetical protein